MRNVYIYSCTLAHGFKYRVLPLDRTGNGPTSSENPWAKAEQSGPHWTTKSEAFKFFSSSFHLHFVVLLVWTHCIQYIHNLDFKTHVYSKTWYVKKNENFILNSTRICMKIFHILIFEPIKKHPNFKIFIEAKFLLIAFRLKKWYHVYVILQFKYLKFK